METDCLATLKVVFAVKRPASILISPMRDPFAKIPGFKVAVVRKEKTTERP